MPRPPQRLRLPVALAITVLGGAALHTACTQTTGNNNNNTAAGSCDAGFDDAGNPRYYYYDDAGRAFEYCPDNTPV